MREAIERHRQALDGDPAGYLHSHESELESRMAEAAASYLSVKALDLAFTDSTTMGLGLVYGGVRSDGTALATEHDFYATHEALRLRFGRVRRIRLYDDPAQATVQGIVQAVERGTDERTGVLVAGCHKWLGGPRGTGLVWSIRAWDRLRATIPTFGPRSYVAWLEGRPPPFDAPLGSRRV